jgi:hypothetical protein
LVTHVIGLVSLAADGDDLFLISVVRAAENRNKAAGTYGGYGWSVRGTTGPFWMIKAEKRREGHLTA